MIGRDPARDVSEARLVQRIGIARVGAPLVPVIAAANRDTPAPMVRDARHAMPRTRGVGAAPSRQAGGGPVVGQREAGACSRQFDKTRNQAARGRPEPAAGGCGGARDANFAQRPHATVCGPAGPGGSGSARDGVAGGRGGARNADFAQQPHATVCGSAGPGGSGSARDGVAGGRGGARNADFAQQPHATVCGSAGPGGSGSARDGVAGGRGGARNADFAQQPRPSPGQAPMQQCAGRQGREGRGPHGTAWLAVVAGRGMRISRNDPGLRRGRLPCNSVRVGRTGTLRVRPGRRGWRSWRGAECGFRATTPCNSVRVGRPGGSGSARDGVAGGHGGARNADFAQQPRPSPGQAPMQQCAGRQGRDGRGPHHELQDKGLAEEDSRARRSLPPTLVRSLRPKPSRGGGELDILVPAYRNAHGGPHRTARRGLAGRGMRISRNDPGLRRGRLPCNSVRVGRTGTLRVRAAAATRMAASGPSHDGA